MNLMPQGYDAWALRSPDEPPQIGTQDGELCNRLPEPDEDAPRGYKPKRCTGTMDNNEVCIICGTCGEIA